MVHIQHLNPPRWRRYAVLADDATGAADVGVAFVHAGLRTRSLVLPAAPQAFNGVEVVVVNTNSRHQPPAHAAESVAKAIAQLQPPLQQATLLYKKIDSTLRGQVGAELKAALERGRRSGAVVCPAFPANGRTLIDGVLLVNGVPVAETAAGCDPVTPVRESHAPTLFRQQIGQHVGHLALEQGKLNEERLQWQLAQLITMGGVLVCDAATDKHLAQIASAALPLVDSVLLAGSAGLAHPLAALLREQTPHNVLVVCGSLHPAARSQAVRLQADLKRTEVVELDVAAALEGGRAWADWVTETLFFLEPMWKYGNVIVLTTPPAGEPVDGARAQQVAAALAELACGAAARQPLSGLVVVGGDTLQSILSRWNSHGLDLHDEIGPGIVHGTVAGGQMAGLPIVTKAGGFGGETALVDAVRYLQDPAAQEKGKST